MDCSVATSNLSRLPRFYHLLILNTPLLKSSFLFKRLRDHVVNSISCSSDSLFSNICTGFVNIIDTTHFVCEIFSWITTSSGWPAWCFNLSSTIESSTQSVHVRNLALLILSAVFFLGAVISVSPTYRFARSCVLLLSVHSGGLCLLRRLIALLASCAVLAILVV